MKRAKPYRKACWRGCWSRSFPDPRRWPERTALLRGPSSDDLLVFRQSNAMQAAVGWVTHANSLSKTEKEQDNLHMVVLSSVRWYAHVCMLAYVFVGTRTRVCVSAVIVASKGRGGGVRGKLVWCQQYLEYRPVFFTFTYPLTAGVVGAPQMTSQPVPSSFLCSPLPWGTWRTPGLSILWCCLLASFSVCLVFFPFSLSPARWFWPDLMNGRHNHTTSVCVSLRCSGLRVVRLPAGSWHLPWYLL